MKLHALEIKNFKVFRELNFIFNGESIVFFGVNGVGKSTILAAICYVFRVFLNQLNPGQTKEYATFEDDMIRKPADQLELRAKVQLKDIAVLSRH